MKKIVIIAVFIFLIVFLLFLWLISRKNSPFLHSSNNVNELPNTSARGVIRNITPVPIPTDAHSLSLIQRLTGLSPYTSTDFDFVYSPDLQKYLITKKTANADTAIKKWAEQNGISSLLTPLNGSNPYSSLYLIRDNSHQIQPNTSRSQPFTNQAIQTLPIDKQTTLNKLKKNPIETDSFSITYSNEFDTYIVEEKNNNAVKDIKNWAQQNGVSDIIGDPKVFIVTDQSGNVANQQLQSDYALALTPTATQSIYNQTITSLTNLFSYLPTPPPDRFVTNPVDSGNSGNSSSNSNSGSNNNVSADVLHIIQSYGLPPPTADGATGYQTLRSNITSNPNALWATKELLNAEKKLSVQNQYLPTAWLWSEIGPGKWPDPYLVNCHDNSDTSLKYSVTVFCPGIQRNGDRNVLLQIAGTQIQDRALFNQIVPMYQKVAGAFGYSDVKSVMQGVYDNSDKASNSYWNYKVQSGKGLVGTYIPSGQVSTNASLDDIATSKTALYSSSNTRVQFFTNLLAKNPGMATALNALELDGDGFVSLLKSGNCLYKSPPIPDTSPSCTYYNRGWKQTLSNMIAALYLVDTGGSSLAATSNNTTNGTNQPAPPPSSGVKSNCGSSQLIQTPGTISKHLVWSDLCIKPTMIVIHWTGSWTPAEVTEATLNQRQLGCQYETDNVKMIQALNIYTDKVERAACVRDYNNTTISNEISGTDFDSVYNNPSSRHYQELMTSTNKAIQVTCWEMKQYNISVDQVYGHLELNPDTKIDPGAKYINYFRDRLRNECK